MHLRHFFLFIACVFCSSLFNRCSPHDEYKKIPAGYYDPVNLIKKVHTDKAYTYWAFCTWPAGKDTVVFSQGFKPLSFSLEAPKGLDGLFSGCYPALCYKYIVYLYNGKIGYVRDANQLKAFLGPIDNLEEALLLAMAKEHLYSDNENVKGSGYFQNAKGYYLRLMKYKPCPETKEAVLLRIQKDSGIVKETNIGAYYHGGGCIVY